MRADHTQTNINSLHRDTDTAGCEFAFAGQTETMVFLCMFGRGSRV